MFRLRCCGLLLISCLELQSSCCFLPSSLASLTLGSQTKSGLTTLFPLEFDNLLQISDTSTKVCPDDVETLTSLMIKDLPNYANRVIQRSRSLGRTNDDSRYVVVAGNPEFEPLTLGPGQYSPSVTLLAEEEPQQVFLTTLERQYIGAKALESQSFHWLFLTQTSDGWRLVMMFTQIGYSSLEHPPMPPQESSNWIIGQAVNLWLRDCRAGAIRPSS